MINRKHRVHGFTLVELTTSIAASALICSGIVVFLTAAMSSSRSGLERSSMITAHEVIVRRLGPVLRNNTCILHIEPDLVLLWRNDLDFNGLPSTDELRMLYFLDGSVMEQSYPESTFPKIQLDLGDDFSSIAMSMLTNPSSIDDPIVDGITDFVLQATDPVPIESRSIMCRVLHQPSDSDTIDIRLHERFRMDAP